MGAEIINIKDHIVNGSSAIRKKETYIDIQEQQVALLIETNANMSKTIEFIREKFYNENALLATENKKYIEENNRMRRMLKNSIPLHTIVFLIINAIVITSCITILVLSYMLKTYIFSPYYLICTLIIGITLFATAGRALYDWRRMLHEGE